MRQKGRWEKVRMSRMYREGKLQAPGNRSEDMMKKDKSHGADGHTHTLCAGICRAGRVTSHTLTLESP